MGMTLEEAEREYLNAMYYPDKRRMTREEAFKTIKENLCGMCAYGSQCMESCDISSCDNRDAIEALQAQDLQPTCNQLANDCIWEQLSRVYNMDDVPDVAKSIIGDVMLGLDESSAQPDAVTASLEELISDYGEDGFFIVDGVNYQANELLNELKANSSVGEKFRKQIAKTIVQYFMKFGD